MEEPTLGTALNRIILLTLLLVGLVTGAYIFGYSRIKQTLSNQAMEESLIRSSGIQTEALLISFLVPEQRTGVPVMLARFKEQDQLDEVRVISSEEELTSEFKGCKLLINSTQRCLSTDKKKFAVIIPISVEGNTFGYLFKAKQIPDLFENDFLLLMMEATAGVMILSFLFLFLFLGRVTSHEVPEDLARLAQWIDDLLGERCPEQMPRLKFKELNEVNS